MNDVFCLLVNDRVIAYACVTAEIIISYLTIGLLHDPVTGTELIMLGRKLYIGAFKTKELVQVKPDFPLFWKSHCVTCVPA